MCVCVCVRACDHLKRETEVCVISINLVTTYT